ncbi:MAG: c-type cytochrome domain-containing protein, partial [Maioricimonas sp. JB049]
MTLGCLLLLPADSTAEDLFRDEVVSILQARCLSCHSAEEKSGGLSLQTADGIKAGGDSGAAMVPGDPAASLLIDMITPADGTAAMPPDGAPLSRDERAAIHRWIEQGAAWPQGLVLEEAAVTDTDWWSLRPLERPSLPELSGEDADWCRTPVDAFILRQHRERGLTGLPEADRRTLIRRLCFDLIGLPPTYEEVEAFVADTQPRAYERL